MKISLATNFDDNLIDEAKKYPVYEIYGKLKNDFIGGGRPDNTLIKVEKDKFEQHVKKVRKSGIKFNYLLNGSCLSNKEQDTNWQNKLKEFLNYLKTVGVNALTVTNPYMLQFVKKYFSNDFTVRVSTFACIDSYEKAKYWEEMGADYICVDFVKINRDFKTLKYMVDNLKHAKLEILVTNSCLKNCPMIHTHTNALSHASMINNKKNNYQDWSLFYCQRKELENLEEYIKSPWIRPEDIKYYEEIGIEHFKITERDFPTSELIKRVKAYTERTYDGNLLDLIQGHGVLVTDNIEFKKNKVTTRDEIYKEIKRVRGLGTVRECERHVYIDNKKLGNFMNFFTENKCTNQCDKCNYCKKIAEKVIYKNDEVYDYLRELYQSFDDVKM
jgi:collagenase-like PrtC family protease